MCGRHLRFARGTQRLSRAVARPTLLPPLDSPQFSSTYSGLPLVLVRSNSGVNRSLVRENHTESVCLKHRAFCLRLWRRPRLAAAGGDHVAVVESGQKGGEDAGEDEDLGC